MFKYQAHNLKKKAFLLHYMKNQKPDRCLKKIVARVALASFQDRFLDVI